MSARRTPARFGYVNWPEPTARRVAYGDAPRSGIADTGEGGMECWLIVAGARRADEPEDGQPPPEPASVRDVAITGFTLGVLWADVVVDEWFCAEWERARRDWRRHSVEQRKRGRLHRPYSIEVPLHVEAAVCVGATGLSLIDYGRDSDYWRPRPQEPDLTPDGVRLYEALQHLYGYGTVHIVMVLDT